MSTAVIVGAGPAGLTAAWELLARTSVTPIVIEKERQVGGISRTLLHKGNRIDIGGHRFFSKSDRVMDWWNAMVPRAPELADPSQDRMVVPDATEPIKQMLVRQRVSRIFFLGQFFDYPVKANLATLTKLGPIRSARIMASYARTMIRPRREEKSLEDFMINRFGEELYRTFFRDYTEKVWGVPCSHIKPEWGAQRIKGLDVSTAISHYVRSVVRRRSSVEQKGVETSLIERFLYPKHGPGQLWEEVADRVVARGGRVLAEHDVASVRREGNRIVEIIAKNTATGEHVSLRADWFFSSMPLSELVEKVSGVVPANVRHVAAGLVYRDFVTVGVLARRLKLKNETRISTRNGLVPDNWIYIQESGVRIGRLQIFNNWSPYMVADPSNVWLGLEYFCNVGDDIWKMDDDELKAFAVHELETIGVLEQREVLDTVVVRVEKTYPAYFGTYDRFAELRAYLDEIENLFPIGRNGMHRYNNSDHSMLTAMTAVDGIAHGVSAKSALWQVNTEQEYIEEK
jgi:protoporphyrinogen oxidase